MVKEIKELETEKTILNNRNDIFRNTFAEQIINGLGDKIIDQINNPVKLTKTKVIKLKIKRFFDMIFNVL